MTRPLDDESRMILRVRRSRAFTCCGMSSRTSARRTKRALRVLSELVGAQNVLARRRPARRRGPARRLADTRHARMVGTAKDGASTSLRQRLDHRPRRGHAGAGRGSGKLSEAASGACVTHVLRDTRLRHLHRSRNIHDAIFVLCRSTRMPSRTLAYRIGDERGAFSRGSRSSRTRSALKWYHRRCCIMACSSPNAPLTPWSAVS
jgi:hypothetical protein